MRSDSYTTLGQPGPFSIPTGNLIGDGWQEGNLARIDVFDPSTGDLLTSVADAGIREAIAAVDAAQDAASDWAATPPRQRAAILLKCFHAMMAERDWLAHVISLESGKALSDAQGEIAYAAEFFRWYSEEAVRIKGELTLSPSGANRIMVQYPPIGISLLITPWNFPAAMATRKIAPALAAGCTCILKPSEETPLTAQAVVEIMRRAGVPAGVVNLINTSDPGPVCSAILHDPRVRKLSFTGSTQVGKALLRQAADQVISCSMELGGNAPFLVFDDANLEQAIEGAMIAKMRNAGEACTAANRIFVQRGIHESFVAALSERMSGIAVGPGTDAKTQCGAMINKASISKIERLIADAVARGAEVKLGGKTLDRPGFFFPPSVISNVQPGSEILSTEVFGPVAAVIPFDHEEEVIEQANATEHGLAAYVYSGNLERALRVAEQIDCGMVAINRGLVSDAAAPFGGVKQSGLGREGSHHGLLEYCEAKYIAVTW